ncbi:MAG: DUF2975 domain-containing protein [Pseudomonadales bacterium]|nr:DUF2975 domain-containing protein [Pseudomonadales bacterium]
MNPKIAFLSRTLSILASLFVVLIPVTVSVLWIFGSEETLLSGLPQYWFVPNGILFQPGTLSESTRIISAGISLVANLPLLLALWQLRGLLELYRNLELFREEAAPRMKKFAAYIVGFALLQPIAGGFLSIVTSINNAEGHRVLSISIADTDIATIFLGLTMIVIAYVLEDAHRLSEDNKSFV